MLIHGLCDKTPPESTYRPRTYANRPLIWSAREIPQLLRKYFADLQDTNTSKLNPFMPYALYQAAVVHGLVIQDLKIVGDGRLLEQSEFEDDYKRIRNALSLFSKRWPCAGESRTSIRLSSRVVLVS